MVLPLGDSDVAAPNNQASTHGLTSILHGSQKQPAIAKIESVVGLISLPEEPVQTEDTTDYQVEGVCGNPAFQHNPALFIDLPNHRRKRQASLPDRVNPFAGMGLGGGHGAFSNMPLAGLVG